MNKFDNPKLVHETKSVSTTIKEILDKSPKNPKNEKASVDSFVDKIVKKHFKTNK